MCPFKHQITGLLAGIANVGMLKCLWVYRHYTVHSFMRSNND